MALNRTPIIFNMLRGRTVLAIKYEKGVLIVADKLLVSPKGTNNHGMERIFKISEIIILGGSGDSADLQSIIDKIEDLKFENDRDGITLTPLMLSSWLTKQFYFHHKNESTLHIDVIVGGLEAGEPFLAHIRHDGSAWEHTTYAACDFYCDIVPGDVSYKNLVYKYKKAEINKLSSCSVEGNPSNLIRKEEALKIIIDAAKHMSRRFKHSNEVYLLGECEIVDKNSCNIAIEELRV